MVSLSLSKKRRWYLCLKRGDSVPIEPWQVIGQFRSRDILFNIGGLGSGSKGLRLIFARYKLESESFVFSYFSKIFHSVWCKVVLWWGITKLWEHVYWISIFPSTSASVAKPQNLMWPNFSSLCKMPLIVKVHVFSMEIGCMFFWSETFPKEIEMEPGSAWEKFRLER